MRQLSLPYSPARGGVPSHLYIVGHLLDSSLVWCGLEEEPWKSLTKGNVLLGKWVDLGGQLVSLISVGVAWILPVKFGNKDLTFIYSL